MRIANATKIVCVLAIFLETFPAAGSIIVTANNNSVTAGTPVSVQLQVSSTSTAAASDIEGMTFTVQIAAGTGTAPKITSLDLLTGTIWAGHVSAGNIFTPTGGNQIQYQSRDLLTDAPGDFVNANGLLATVSIDTAGANPGNYAIKLNGTKTAGRDSSFLNGLGDTISTSFGQGNITIAVPEPSGLVLAVVGIWILSVFISIFWQRVCT